MMAIVGQLPNLLVVCATLKRCKLAGRGLSCCYSSEMLVQTVSGDRHYYRLFYLQRLVLQRSKWSPCLRPGVSCL